MAGTAAVILAAGAATRMGTAKQLLDLRGRPLLRHAAEGALAAACWPVLVVTGCRAAEVEAGLRGLPVEVVRNPRWEEGLGTSIRAGTLRAEAAGAEGLLLLLADQPLITAAHLRRLIASRQQAGLPLAVSEYGGTVGVPACFTRELFPELLALPPAEGCKRLVLSRRGQAVGVPCPEAAVDVDTPQEYAALRDRPG